MQDRGDFVIMLDQVLRRTMQLGLTVMMRHLFSSAYTRLPPSKHKRLQFIFKIASSGSAIPEESVVDFRFLN